MTPTAPDAGLGPVTRRSLIAGTVGVASTLAVTKGLSAPGDEVAGAGAAIPQLVPTAGALPAHPVIAYVHDAARGEVTVIAGHRELTYHDPELAARLIAAAPKAVE